MREIDLPQFAAVQLTATLRDIHGNSQNVTNQILWLSDNTSIVSVNSSGALTAGSVTGTAIISAYYGDAVPTGFVRAIVGAGPLLNNSGSDLLVHAFVANGAWVDIKGNSWDTHGIPTFNASASLGTLGDGTKVAETVSGFSDSNYFSLGSGSDVLDFGSIPFVVTLIYRGGAQFQTLISDHWDANSIGWDIEGALIGIAFREDSSIGNPGTGFDASNYRVITFFRTAAGTVRCKLNGAAITQVIVSSSLIAVTGTQLRVGRADNPGLSFGGSIAEFRAAAGAADYADVYVTALHAELGY